MRRLWEAWLVWLLFGLTTVAVFVSGSSRIVNARAA